MAQLEIMMEPQCLVDMDEHGNLRVDENVLKQLMTLEKDLVVVAIAGPYRTGKSYLMNKLAQEKKGFPVDATVQSKTKGIWIWAREHPIKEDKYLILLDTEGLGDIEQGDENRGNKFLCLSILLASVFVYNVMGVIGSDAIMKLHFVTKLSKHIRSFSESDSVDSNFDTFFPNFVYLVRDFTLSLEIDGVGITSDEYLENCLTMKPGDEQEVTIFNKVRSCIRSYFKNRNCFTFRPPFMGEFGNLEEIPEDKLLPAFLKNVESFVNHIFVDAPVKKIRGKKITGSMFGTLLEVYVNQMATGVPYVESVVETMAQQENNRAKQGAVAMYYTEMLKTLNVPVFDDSVVSQCHSQCVEIAVDDFLKKAIFDENHIFQKQIEIEIEMKYRELVLRNESRCQKACFEALEIAYADIQRKVSKGDYAKSGGFREYKNDVDQFQKTFEAENSRLATKMRHIFLEFLHSKKTEEDVIMHADENVREAEKKHEEELRRADEIEREKKQLERENVLIRKMHEDIASVLMKILKKLDEKTQENLVEEQKYVEDVVTRRLKERHRLIKEGFKFKQAHMDLNSQINSLQREIKSSLCLIQ